MAFFPGSDGGKARMMPRLFEEYPPVARRLMVAAERLYGQHGLDGVSLRQIVAAAGQSNNNAVPLHFGSKAGLVRAVGEMRLPLLEAERLVLLEQAHLDKDRSVRRMLGIMLFPLVTVLSEQDLEHYARFILAVIRVKPEDVPFLRTDPELAPASIELEAELVRALPDLPPTVFRRRLSLACNLFLGAASQVGGPLRLMPTGYQSRDAYFLDMFEAALAVLNTPFDPAADRNAHLSLAPSAARRPGGAKSGPRPGD
jgi:AcrR family transcriptional regulator